MALLDQSGVLGGIIHIANHGFSKITLFFCAGAIYVAHHKKKISDMAGIGYAMPFTMGAFALASLSMIGVPPVAGFVTKWYLLNGALEIQNIPILIVLMASTILNAGYFVPITIRAFFEGKKERWSSSDIKEAPLTMVVPICPGRASSRLSSASTPTSSSGSSGSSFRCRGLTMNVLNITGIPEKECRRAEEGLFSASWRRWWSSTSSVPRKEAHYFVDTIWAFWTLFTLVGCFVLIKFSKGIAHMFLSKDEDYYG